MTSYSVITPTSIGTGVARTTLGTNDKPSDTTNLIEFTPYYAPAGAITASESALLATEITSVSVADILPKRIINPPIQATLGATAASMIPILESYECNTLLDKGSNSTIEAFGQAQIANTVAMVMGVELHYSDSPPSMPQMFYEKPDNETAAGTAATTVTGNNMVINGGVMLMVLMAELAAATPTADESYISSMQFNSPNFANSQNVEIAVQPLVASLGALIGILQPKATIKKRLGMGMKPTTTITPVININEALAGDGNFIAGVGYNKVLTAQQPRRR